MQYEVIRDQSEDRRAEVTNRFETANRQYQETHAVVRPLIAYLEDIRRALNMDLTTGGLASVKSIVSNADENAAKVQMALARLANELAASGTRMSSVAVHNEEQPVVGDNKTPVATR
jgi:hypothetical protein